MTLVFVSGQDSFVASADAAEHLPCILTRTETMIEMPKTSVTNEYWVYHYTLLTKKESVHNVSKTNIQN